MSIGSDGLDACAVHCPYCGEPIDLTIDASAGTQRYVEDCAVCCQPIEVSLDVDDAGVRVRVQRESEA